MTDSFECTTCGFRLWVPIAHLPASMLGLYNDDRFPGRCILALKMHADRWEDLDADLLHAFVDDSKVAIKAIRMSTGAKRVNIAVLGNTDSHVHFHLIPRYPESEPYPGKSPWNDTREQETLPDEQVARLQKLIAAALPRL